MKKYFIENFKNKVSNIYIGIQNRHIYKDLQKELKNNQSLKNIHVGKRCFVLGNAPSLKSQDLSVLKDEIVITVNQISRNPQFKELNSNYHFWADPGFFKKNTENGDNELLNVMKSVNVGENKPICFYPLFAKNFIKENNLDQELDVHYFLPAYKFYSNYPNNIDFCNIVPGFNTVVDYGILLAIYMGCKEIYLLGCDCTGVINYIESKTSAATSGYSYTISENEAHRMKKMVEDVSCESTFEGWMKIFQGYRQLNTYCFNKRIKLVNCTNGGILDCLPREKFEDVILKK